MKHKLLILPLLIALLIVNTFTVFATEETTNSGVSVTSVAGAAGKEVKVRVAVNSVFADNIGLAFEYDTEVLELLESTEWMLEGKLTDVDLEENAAIWGDDAKDIKGEIFEFVFRIKDGVEIGTTANVSCTVRAMWNSSVELEATGTGTVTVQNLAKISGTVTSYGDATAPVTVQLLDSTGEALETVTLEDDETGYEFNVEQGTYTLRVQKTKHCPRDYEVLMANLEDKEQDVEILLYGDVNGNGKLQSVDASWILKHLNGQTIAAFEDEYIQKVADINENGKLQSVDVSHMLKHLNGATSMFDTIE